jgi:hypothetical protein
MKLRVHTSNNPTPVGPFSESFSLPPFCFYFCFIKGQPLSRLVIYRCTLLNTRSKMLENNMYLLQSTHTLHRTCAVNNASTEFAIQLRMRAGKTPVQVLFNDGVYLPGIE